MSWNFCAISGEQVQEPVVSKVSGHVFEKRLIEKHIASTGQCPITGRALTSDDLIPVTLATQTKPRSVTMNSVPGILKSFTSEWDALMLETYQLKQHLETVRQQLSHALYQHDAACRVIARLIKERDDARNEVTTLQEKLSQSHRMEQEEEVVAQTTQNGTKAVGPAKLPGVIIASINETALKLSGVRKERRKDVDYNNKFAQPEVVATFGPKLINDQQKTTTTLDLHKKQSIVASGSTQGQLLIHDVKTNQVIASTTLSLPIVGVTFLGEEDDQPRIVVITEQSAHQYILSREAKTLSLASTFESDVSLTSVAAHPNGSLFILAAENGKFTYHDVNSAGPVLTVEDLEGKVKLLSIQVHPDGNLLGLGCNDGSVKLWNITSNEIVTSLEDNIKGGINLIRFSENGYTLAAGSTEQKVIKIFDLRKGKCVQSIFGELEGSSSFELTALEFDLSGNVLAVGNKQGAIRLIETKKWSTLSTFSLHESSVTGLKFNSFSLSFVSGSEDGKVIVSSQ